VGVAVRVGLTVRVRVLMPVRVSMGAGTVLVRAGVGVGVTQRAVPVQVAIDELVNGGGHAAFQVTCRRIRTG
jgi:hypothetical protein